MGWFDDFMNKTVFHDKWHGFDPYIDSHHVRTSSIKFNLKDKKLHFEDFDKKTKHTVAITAWYKKYKKQGLPPSAATYIDEHIIPIQPHVVGELPNLYVIYYVGRKRRKIKMKARKYMSLYDKTGIEDDPKIKRLTEGKTWIESLQENVDTALDAAGDLITAPIDHGLDQLGDIGSEIGEVPGKIAAGFGEGANKAASKIFGFEPKWILIGGGVLAGIYLWRSSNKTGSKTSGASGAAGLTAKESAVVLTGLQGGKTPVKKKSKKVIIEKEPNLTDKQIDFLAGVKSYEEPKEYTKKGLDTAQEKQKVKKAEIKKELKSS